MPKRPHIIVFNPDQWRGDSLGHMDHPAAVTPYLDRFVQQDAVSFRNAFVQNTVCTPSRCSFMTGWYPHVRGHRTMFHMLRRDEPMLLKTLKDEGYFVWWGGKNDLTPAQYGYDDYCNVHHKTVPFSNPDLAGEKWRGAPGNDAYYSFYIGRLNKHGQDIYNDHDWQHVLGAIDFLRHAPKDKPLCLYLPLGYPHPPYGVEDPFYSMIDRSKIPPRAPVPEDWAGKPSLLKGIWQNQRLQNLKEPFWTELRATYLGMCARVDRQFGLLLDALRETGIYDDTAVFFFSDHGDFTGDYGLVEKTQNTFEDCLSRVPFLIKPPKGIAVKPRISDALVELVDFSATVEALTGICPRHDHFGRSLLRVLSGETDEHRDAVFCEGGRLAHETHCKELESNAKEGTLYWPRIVWQCGDGPEHTKATMCRTKEYKYVARLYESDELYDLRADPSELKNRIDDPALAGVRDALRQRLLRFYLETSDVVPHDIDRRW
jgi:arylsulfatase A-like enzyme